MSESLSITAATPGQRPVAEALAARWGFRLHDGDTDPYRLVVTDTRLELHPRDPDAGGAICVDWAAGAAAHRRRFGGGRGQPLARAVGLRGGASPEVVDATAGFGRDAFVLACLGCRVTLLERSPVVAALLEDGYRRACADGEIGDLVQDRMMVKHADAVTALSGLEAIRRPDVVYLDPMYPERRKSSLVKKEMRALQCLLHPEPRDDRLLSTAIAVARERVVVKRPMSAPPLNDRPPTMSIKGKHHRYDVYVIKAMSHETR